MTGARLTPRERLLREIPEKHWQQKVENIASAYGWMVYHPPDNRPVAGKSGRRYVQNVRAGFPDLVAAHRRLGLMLIAELKTETGRVTAAQHEWITTLQQAVSARMRVEVLRPRDEDRVVAMLDPARLEGWEDQ